MRRPPPQVGERVRPWWLDDWWDVIAPLGGPDPKCGGENRSRPMTDPRLRVVHDERPLSEWGATCQLECEGGCGRWSPPTPAIAAICEFCYRERYGEPAVGFVGFIEGWHYTSSFGAVEGDYGEGKTRLQDAEDSHTMIGVLLVLVGAGILLAAVLVVAIIMLVL